MLNTYLRVDSNVIFLLSSVPVWLVWFKYIGWFLYTNELLVINQWNGLDINTCPPINNTSTDSKLTLSTESKLFEGSESPNGFCFTDGDQVITSVGFDKVSQS